MTNHISLHFHFKNGLLSLVMLAASEMIREKIPQDFSKSKTKDLKCNRQYTTFQLFYLIPQASHEQYTAKDIYAVLFVGPLIPLFWTSGDVCPGFQSQACFLACTLFFRFTCAATPADLLKAGMAARRVPYMFSRGRMLLRYLHKLWEERNSFCTVRVLSYFQGLNHLRSSPKDRLLEKWQNEGLISTLSKSLKQIANSTNWQRTLCRWIDLKKALRSFIYLGRKNSFHFTFKVPYLSKTSKQRYP